MPPIQSPGLRSIMRSSSGGPPNSPAAAARHRAKGPSRPSSSASPPRLAPPSTPESSTRAKPMIPTLNPPTSCAESLTPRPAWPRPCASGTAGTSHPPSPPSHAIPGLPAYSPPDARRIVAEDVLIIAERLGHRALTTGHILIAILERPDEHAGEIISSLAGMHEITAAGTHALPGGEATRHRSPSGDPRPARRVR